MGCRALQGASGLLWAQLSCPQVTQASGQTAGRFQACPELNRQEWGRREANNSRQAFQSRPRPSPPTGLSPSGCARAETARSCRRVNPRDPAWSRPAPETWEARAEAPLAVAAEKAAPASRGWPRTRQGQRPQRAPSQSRPPVSDPRFPQQNLTEVPANPDRESQTREEPVCAPRRRADRSAELTRLTFWCRSRLKRSSP